MLRWGRKYEVAKEFSQPTDYGSGSSVVEAGYLTEHYTCALVVSLLIHGGYIYFMFDSCWPHPLINEQQCAFVYRTHFPVTSVSSKGFAFHNVTYTISLS